MFDDVASIIHQSLPPGAHCHLISVVPPHAPRGPSRRPPRAPARAEELAAEVHHRRLAMGRPVACRYDCACARETKSLAGALQAARPGETLPHPPRGSCSKPAALGSGGGRRHRQREQQLVAAFLHVALL